MNFKIDLKVVSLEPQVDGLTLIQGRAADGTQAMIAVRVVEPLPVGSVLSMALWTQPTEAVKTSRNLVGRTVGLHESLGLTRDVDDEMDAFMGPPKSKQS